MQASISPITSAKLANMGFLCACLVVVSHIFVQPEADAPTFWARELLIRIHAIDVPFFFLAAGYFLAGHVSDQKWWGGEVLKRTKTLLVPFLLWSLLWMICEQLLGIAQSLLDGKSPTLCISLETATLLASFGFDPLRSPALPPLWFVRTLFCLVVLSPLLVVPIKWGRRCGMLWTGTLLAIFWGYVVLLGSPYSALFGVSSFLTVSGFFWFTLGLFLRLHPCLIRLPIWGGVTLLIATLGVEVGAFLWLPQQSICARLIPFVGGLTLMLAVWSIIPGKAWPRWLTSTAFPIYLMHWFVLFPLAGLLGYPASFPIYLFFVIVGIVLPLACTHVLRHCCPKTASLLFGGR